MGLGCSSPPAIGSCLWTNCGGTNKNDQSSIKIQDRTFASTEVSFAGLSWGRELHAHLLRELSGQRYATFRSCGSESLFHFCFSLCAKQAATACLALNGQLLLGKIMACALPSATVLKLHGQRHENCLQMQAPMIL